ncbi:MAG: hypothetical protein IKR04_06085 [Clostridia bacterium]|nr:hypothetical protein [Clostridia bacterium]
MQKAMTHFGYLEEVLGIRAANNPDYFEKCINVMRSYEKSGDEWWLSANPIELAKHQVDESILLIPFEILKDALIKVLGRNVEDDEISIKNEVLITEFKNKVETYKPALAVS